MVSYFPNTKNSFNSIYIIHLGFTNTICHASNSNDYCLFVHRIHLFVQLLGIIAIWICFYECDRKLFFVTRLAFIWASLISFGGELRGWNLIFFSVSSDFCIWWLFAYCRSACFHLCKGVPHLALSQYSKWSAVIPIRWIFIFCLLETFWEVEIPASFFAFLDRLWVNGLGSFVVSLTFEEILSVFQSVFHSLPITLGTVSMFFPHLDWSSLLFFIFLYDWLWSLYSKFYYSSLDFSKKQLPWDGPYNAYWSFPLKLRWSCFAFSVSQYW